MKDQKRPSAVTRIVGVIGELLITAGIVVGLFVVWQVWWTDIGANKEQSATIDTNTTDWDRSEQVGEPRYTDPPAFGHTETEGDFLAVMRIPRFGLGYEHSIKQGVGLTDILDQGNFGHYPSTAFPGEVGNFAVSAHRQTYGAAMRDVQKLAIGDPVIVETENAYLVYRVSESYIVEPSDTDVILPVPRQPGVEADKRILTITTCHPPFVSDQRWVIHAEFDHWVDPSDGIPIELTKEK